MGDRLAGERREVQSWLAAGDTIGIGDPCDARYGVGFAFSSSPHLSKRLRLLSSGKPP